MSDVARHKTERQRIIVVGYLVRGPLGGLAWHYLQYVVGLHRLGHDVYFVEDSEDYPACYDPQQNAMVMDPAYGMAFAKEAFDRLGLPDCWGYFDAHRGTWLGPLAGRIEQVIREAELLINVSGVTPIRHGLEYVPRRALIDTDPAFTQLRNIQDPRKREESLTHTHHFSFGENVGCRDCLVPDDGMRWLPTRQPIVTDLWPVAPPAVDGAFSTVMQWESYAAADYNGVRFGMKSDSFAPYMHLPEATGYRFDLAVGSPTAPLDQLRKAGWNV
ncbi:MAG: hypothetical protein KDA60_20495, partial [Planctomycetales bacterium]|nr:hypothetical protein [Planctomycetales bacterium]